jgi:signal transduction histidine kinase
MPLLLRLRALRLNERADLSGVLLAIRRGAIVLVMLLGYGYFRLAGEAYALVSIGLISFAAVAQFAPAMLGGMYWRGGTRAGALAGLLGGFAVWTYTLLLPSFAKSGWLPASFIEQGPWGIELLKPLALFGLVDLDQITHAMIWSMLANLGGYIGLSLVSRQGMQERAQAALFVDAFRQGEGAASARFWRGSASLPDLQSVLARYLGPAPAEEALSEYARHRGIAAVGDIVADAELVHFAETHLAGAIGAASARVLIASVVKEEELGFDELMGMLDEASQVIAYSHELEEKSKQLEAATADLRAANERLKELDRLKDEFVSTVSHELRTPLTSIRAFSEILHDHPDLSQEERTRYLKIVVTESERLSRLINDVLDLAKIESGSAEWHVTEIDLREVIEDSVTAMGQIFSERGVKLDVEVPREVPTIHADRDRLMQVIINLLSNAAKFCATKDGKVGIRLSAEANALRVNVRDNGRGVRSEEREVIFEKFRQVGDTLTGKPQGTGLGLPISRQIISHFGGRLWVENAAGAGATFSFTLPLATAK